MISEKEFGSGFSAFWAECTPFMTPHLIAELNLNARVLTDDGGRPLKPMIDKEGEGKSNDLIAEAAFELWAKSVSAGKDVLSLAEDGKLLDDIKANSIARLMGLRAYWHSIGGQFPKTGMHKSIELAIRLERFFTEGRKGNAILIQPRFKGCGLLNSCYGDVLIGSTLYEVKTVERNLRSTDIRQALIYSALNYFSQQYDIQCLSIVNPRRGVEHLFRLERLTERVANKTPAELFHYVTDFLFNFETMHQAQ
jgi:hypothetical protein